MLHTAIYTKLIQEQAPQIDPPCLLLSELPDQRLLLFPCQPFDLDFPLQSIRMSTAFLPVDKLQRAAATGVFGTLSASVGFQPLFHIGGNTGVQGAVPAAEDV